MLDKGVSKADVGVSHDLDWLKCLWTFYSNHDTECQPCAIETPLLSNTVEIFRRNESLTYTCNMFSWSRRVIGSGLRVIPPSGSLTNNRDHWSRRWWPRNLSGNPLLSSLSAYSFEK